MDNVINVLVSFEILPEAAESAQKDLQAFHEASKNEPGLVYMHIMRDNDNPSQVFIVEAWKTQQDFEAHITTKHFLVFGEVIQKKFRSMSIKKLRALS